MTQDLLSPSEFGLTKGSGSSYNNVGICCVALMAVLEECESLPLVKALIVMPLAMHDATVRHLGSSRTKMREISALISARPDLFLNFNSRFVAGLVPSINAIQLLVEMEYVVFDTELRLVRKLVFTDKLGQRSLRIKRAAAGMALILAASEKELYLNLRVQL